MLALTACGGVSESTTTTTSSPNPSTPEATPDDSSSQAAVWHKEQVDATNLRIDSNGRFRWSISGCDFGGGDQGRWEKHPEGGIVLLPAPGYDFFTWSHEGFGDQATALRLTRSGDEVTIQGSMENGSTLKQTWKSGCACAICGGNRGPTGQETCKAPLPEICVPE